MLLASTCDVTTQFDLSNVYARKKRIETEQENKNRTTKQKESSAKGNRAYRKRVLSFAGKASRRY